jgi:DNA-binding transcriptional ArsR family regulator
VDSAEKCLELAQRAIRFNIIIAGSSVLSEYSPYIALSSQIRKVIVIGLHEGCSVEDIARSIGASRDEVLSHLEFLREAGYVVERDSRLVPTFFIALREEVARVKGLAKRLSAELAKRYESSWDLIVETYHKLSVSSRFSFDRVAFVLVGAYSLDIYMLEKFAEEGRLMPRAPRRKSGSFYMWGIEGAANALGKCGMHSGRAGEYGFATFGCEEKRKRKAPPDHLSEVLLELMNERDLTNALTRLIKLPSSERERIFKEIEEATSRILREYERRYYDSKYKLSSEVEEYLKKWMYVDEDLTPLSPIYTKKDLDSIKDFTDKMSIHVFDVVNENLDRIKDAFKECKASEYADFAEFFCWFYHLLFSETLDYLVAKQKLKPPVHGYEYWVWKET